TSLILPGAANVTTSAGDTCIALSDASGNWRLFAYARASGKATVGPAAADISDATAVGKAGLTAAHASGVHSAIGVPRANYLVNPTGQFAQAGTASTSDGSYTGVDQWYALTQSNPVTPSQLTDVENTTPFMMRLTQVNASAQRFGLAQVVESIF